MKLKTSLIGVSVSFALISLLVSCGDKPVAPMPPKDPEPIPKYPSLSIISTSTTKADYNGTVIINLSSSNVVDIKRNGVSIGTSGADTIKNITGPMNLSYETVNTDKTVSTVTVTQSLSSYTKDETALYSGTNPYAMIENRGRKYNETIWLYYAPICRNFKFLRDYTMISANTLCTPASSDASGTWSLAATTPVLTMSMQTGTQPVATKITSDTLQLLYVTPVVVGGVVLGNDSTLRTWVKPK